ncbi:hypothetical protein T484DRAFT_1807367, partial [Baffinella frigidus]
GKALGWFNLATFNASEYLDWGSPEGGLLHVISPKLVSFRSPSDTPCFISFGVTSIAPAAYAPKLLECGASCVVSLGAPFEYSPEDFASFGLSHYSLDWPPGVLLTDEIVRRFLATCDEQPGAMVRRFLAICDEEPGAVALHDEPGLERMGILMANFLVSRNGFSPDEAVAWIRLVRPGSILAEQHEALRAFSKTSEDSSLRSVPPKR